MYGFFRYKSEEGKKEEKIGKKVEAPTIDSGVIELLFLCYNGNFRTLELLIKSNSHLLTELVKGSIGECPNKEHEEIWQKIENVIKEKSTELTVGGILLCFACLLNDQQLVTLLIDKGTDPNTLNDVDETISPLYIACKNGNVELVAILSKQKVEITTFLVEQYPEVLCQIMERYVQKHRVLKMKESKKTTITKTTFKLSWEHLRLHAIHRRWLEVHKYEITRVELTKNKLTSLPEEFFHLLPHLEDFDVSSNMLQDLPCAWVAESKLKHIDVSGNQLTSIPPAYFMNSSVKTMDISNNKIEVLPRLAKKWKCTSLTKLNCSQNLLSTIPKSAVGASGLVELLLMFNKFKTFDRSWKCPLNGLNLSHNNLEGFNCKADSAWSKSLRTINLSYNELREIPACVLRLTKLEDLKLHHNKLQTLPQVDEWKTKQLRNLDLSHNQLSTTPIIDGFLDIETNAVQFNHSCELPVKLLSDTLQTLNLSYNMLDHVPESLSLLNSLGYLDLSNNPGITEIPPYLGKLKNIWSLNLSGLEINNVPFKLEGINHVQVLSFLRAQLRKSKPFNRIKLMLVGLQGRGKTTLIHAIQGKPIPENISTVGIAIDQFVLPLRYSYIADMFWNSKQEIVFSAWDLAGQQVYYATHQCFLTGKALYLVVFNVTHGNEGIDALGPWLLNIQARAPNSRCIIVGTHVDLMPVIRKEETLKKFTDSIVMRFCKVGFPVINLCVYVSGTTHENIERLREVIYREAEDMINDSATGKLAPISYLELYDRIVEESILRKKENRPPILTTGEMLELADRSPNNDILDFEELCSAAKFFHENGLMLHFDDHLRGLNNLFFIEPSWLIDIVSLVVTVRQRNPFVKNGYINEGELKFILKNPWLPENFIPQYLRLLERFEILLSLEDGRFLIPCMLPQEKPDIDDKMLHMIITSQDIQHTVSSQNDRIPNYLTRNYHMEYIPAGFWARLIARLVIAVQKWSLQITSSSELSDSGHIGYTTHLWRKGILITYEDGYFLVESFFDEELRPKRWSNRGVAITVWSKVKDFSVMGFIVDHLEMLITEWYPGLEGLNDYGNNLVQKLISCPICSAEKVNDIIKCCDKEANDLRNHYSSFFRNELFVNQFSLGTCAHAAIRHSQIICKNHPKRAVPLHLLIPEIMMTDLPPNFRINHEDLDFDPSTSTILGDGGAGVVYLGRYCDMNVAVKRSHTVIMKKNDAKENDSDVFDPATLDSSEDTGLVVGTFWELRQEVLVLCTLNHPNIIEFLGVCFSPLSFVIEFAPLGSLYGVVERKTNETRQSSTPSWPVLGNRMTYLIAFQIIEAIRYLHSWGIIYRDLKSENVLVMSLDQKDIVNVKLSDYGIVAFATPQGVTGVAGTPAFQAPEVQKDNTYDEKVDIFSFGIWLFEMISGVFPYMEYKSVSEIKKAIIQGARPSFLKEGIIVELNYMGTLMKSCWQHDPSSRLSSVHISSLFTRPDLCCITHIYPNKQDEQYLEHITCMCTWETEFPGNTLHKKLLLWNNKNEDRTFILFDMRCSAIRWKDSLPGPRVSYACQVERNVWLGCETKREIQVFGYSSNCDLPKILWTFSDFDDEILMIISHEEEGKINVFASLANGKLAIFTKVLHQEVLKTAIENEEETWDQKVIDLNTNNRPAKCMAITNFSKELWVGSGNVIAIYNIDTGEIVDRLPIKKDSDKHSLVSLICSDGKNIVWTSLWKSGYIVQWDVERRVKTFDYYCGEANPFKKSIRCESGSLAGLLINSGVEVDVDCTVDVTTPILSQKTFCIENVLAKESLYKRPCLRFPSRTYVKHKSLHKQTSHSSLFDTSHVKNLTAQCNNNVTSLQLATSLLWIGRSSGDILVVDIHTGQVVSILGDDSQDLLGGDLRYIQSVVRFGSDKMAACVRKRMKAGSKVFGRQAVPLDYKQLDSYQILVYNVWSSEEFSKFNERVNNIFIR